MSEEKVVYGTCLNASIDKIWAALTQSEFTRQNFSGCKHRIELEGRFANTREHGRRQRFIAVSFISARGSRPNESSPRDLSLGTVKRNL